MLKKSLSDMPMKVQGRASKLQMWDWNLRPRGQVLSLPHCHHSAYPKLIPRHVYLLTLDRESDSVVGMFASTPMIHVLYVLLELKLFFLKYFRVEFLFFYWILMWLCLLCMLREVFHFCAPLKVTPHPYPRLRSTEDPCHLLCP